MALYKHVVDKEDLLDGMVDAAIRGFGVEADDDRPWRDAVRAAALAARRAVLARPWLRRAIETRTARSAAVLGHMEAVTHAFLRGGFSPDLTHHVMHTLGNRIWGFSPELFNDPARPQGLAGPPRAPVDPTDHPGIMAVAADARRRRPEATGCDEDFEFVFALDLILDAAERLHRAGWSSDRRPPERDADDQGLP